MRPGGGPGVFHEHFLLFHFGFGGGADVDLRHSAGQLGQALLEFFAIVFAGGGFDFIADLLGPALDGLFAAAAHDDGGVFGGDGHFFRRAQIGNLDRFERHAKILEDGLGAGQCGDVAQHGLAAVAVARGLYGAHIQNAAEFVDHQGCQGLAFDVFGDDQKRLARLAHGFQQGDEILGVGDFFFVNQDQAFFEFHGLLVLIGDEMGERKPRSNCMPSTTST